MVEKTSHRASDMGPVVAAGLFIAVGLALGGWFIGDGFVDGRKPVRVVTVKGLAEIEVRADVATWPLGVTAAGDVLADAQVKIEADTARVRAFLEERGVPAEDIRVENLRVTDQLSEQYRSSPIQGNRFIINQTVTVLTDQIDLVQTLVNDTGQLVRDGVILQDLGGPTFAFTRLSEVKPELIAQATRSARASAEQFAADSGARVGSILRANQGVIQILPPLTSGDYGYGEAQHADKKIRVVATVEFLLGD